MTIRHLRIFLSLIDNDANMTRCAKALNMTQPAVSIAINEMENYYGLKFFERLGRHLYITEAGKMYSDTARHIITLFDQMERRSQNWSEEGTIRIGASVTIGTRFMTEYVKSFISLHPHVEVKVFVDQSMHLEQMLIEDRVDLALMEGLTSSDALLEEEYMDDSLAAICAPSGFFKKDESVSLSDFSRCRFLLREKGSGTREEFEIAARKAGFIPHVLWESISTSALIEAVAGGLGVSVLPYRLVERALEEGRVISFNVDKMDFKRKFRIVCHKDKYISPLLNEFVSLIRASV